VRGSQDLRTFKVNLNEFPHPNRGPHVPTEIIIPLFTSVAGRRRSRAALSVVGRNSKA
jgi:hypothetical protein